MEAKEICPSAMLGRYDTKKEEEPLRELKAVLTNTSLLRPVAYWICTMYDTRVCRLTNLAADCNPFQRN